MSNFWQDLRFGFRMLLKRPGYTAIAIGTLALGIGANTAIFSFVDSILLRPLPFLHPERLVWMEALDLKDNTKSGSISPPDFVDYREQAKSFENLAAYQALSFTITGEGAEPERVAAARVSANFFDTFGVKPLGGGRTFLPEEEQEGRNGVAVISYGFWQKRFGADPNLIGKTININGQKGTVVGIMPAGFQFPSETDLWTPIAFKTPQMSVRRFHFLQGIGRLKNGITAGQAQSELISIARQLEKLYPDSNTDYGAGLTPLPERIVGDMSQTLLVMAFAVGFVLLIACANVANLSLARSSARNKEIAIRTTLGASRLRLIRQLLTENVLLALCGGTLGFLLAFWGVDALVSLSPPNIPRIKDVVIDGWVLGFTLLVSLCTGLLFGLAPVLQVSRFNVNESLKEGGRGSSVGAGQRKLRSVLVISEVALSLLLLIGAGLMIKSFIRLANVDPGFKTDKQLTMFISLTRNRYAQDEQRVSFFQNLLQRVENLPGVEAAGTVSELPMSGMENDTNFTIEGRPTGAPGAENNANQRVVSADYFRAMNIPLLRGRYFTSKDQAKSPKVVIISESFVRKFFPNEDALGKHISIDFGVPWTAEIIGIVGNIHQNNLALDPYREMYVSDTQTAPFQMSLVVSTSLADPAQLTNAVRNEVRDIDRDMPLYRVKTMEQLVSESAARPRLRTLLLSIFAGLALVLASIGIYGVMSYSVTQRTHEIGIRLALGAQTGDVLKGIIRQGMLLAITGMVIGLILSFALTQVIASLLYDVSTTDLLTFTVVPILLMMVGLLACYLPARRATRVDPLVALRYE